MAQEELNNTLSKQELKAQKKEQKLALKEQKRIEKEKLAKKSEKNKKEKKSLFKRIKETFSELKKVTWPTFSTVVKNTTIVLVVVLCFTVVLFGIDYLLGLLYSVFTSKLG